MKQAVVREPFGLDGIAILSVTEEPTVPLGPNEIILEMHAATLVWRDLAEARHAKKAYVPLSDGVGTVIAIGEVSLSHSPALH